MQHNRDALLSPVLIVGCPRSGTTWLQKLLLEHPSICGGQESYFYSLFHPAFESVADRVDARRVGLSTYWSIEDFDEQMRDVWCNTFSSQFEFKPTASILLDKTPFHALYLDKIARFLPQAKFIHLIRDSRSVAASLMDAGKSWGDYWAPTTIREAALEWYRHVKYARNAKIAKDNSRYIEVHYEDLIENPVNEIQVIMDFIGITYNDSQLEHAIQEHKFKKEKIVGCHLPNSSQTKIEEPAGFLRKGTIDSWKKDLNLYQKAVVWLYTRNLMAECGYTWQGKIGP